MSVVIPAWNEEDIIEGVVRSIFDQHYPGDLEVLVVNDCSTDSTKAILDELAQEFAGLRPIHQAENTGQGVAKNNGLSRARHEVVVGVDADTELTPGALEAIVAPLADPDVSAVAGNVQVLNDDASLLTRFQSLEYLLAMDMARMFQCKFRHLMCISGAFGAFRRERLEEAGGWIAPNYCAEDMGITVSMHEFGHVAYAPGAVALTEAPPTVRGLFRQRVIWQRNGLNTIVRHKHTLFNRKFGVLGSFALPFRVVSSVLLVASVATAGYALVTHGLAGSIPVRTLVTPFLLAGFGMILMATALAVTRHERSLDHVFALPVFLLLYQPSLVFARIAGTIFWGRGLALRAVNRAPARLKVQSSTPEPESEPAD
ncbi:glycosyltransferase [Halomarina oriensis]|uniref:Glycosyltransferase n=1 Tax=Halomarina oriensis TaxID=671145 RepID=A0A6B0GTF9_9EURY|nr:glycosyltransferase [Halomarina oriensis]